jgi:hypothetical protein
MPRFRLTVRRLMAAIAVVALALGLATMLKRSADFRALAAEQADAEAMSLSYADEARGANGDRQRVARGEQMAAYHRALRIKYEYAARYPWITPEPDPPIPEPPP